MSGWKDWLVVSGSVVALLVGMELLVAGPIKGRLDRMEERITNPLENIEGNNEILAQTVNGIREVLVGSQLMQPGFRYLPGNVPITGITEDENGPES